MVFRFSERADFITVRIKTEDMSSAVSTIKTTFQKNFPNSTFDYFFVDEMYDRQYRAEVQFGQVVVTFSIFAVVIACLGLFGLSSYTISQRTKEIGIRKVLGASVAQIVSLLSGSFIRVVMIAAVLALPLAWWAMREWLSNYAVRIDLNVWIFVIPVAAITMIALATVSFQTFRSAIANPVSSLKQE